MINVEVHAADRWMVSTVRFPFLSSPSSLHLFSDDSMSENVGTLMLHICRIRLTFKLYLPLALCFPSGNVQHELQRRPLINIPEKDQISTLEINAPATITRLTAVQVSHRAGSLVLLQFVCQPVCFLSVPLAMLSGALSVYYLVHYPKCFMD